MSVEGLERQPNPYIHPVMEKFFVSAIRDGAFLTVNWDRDDTVLLQEKRWRMFVRYYFTPLSLQEIGEKEAGEIEGKKLTRQRVHQLIKYLTAKVYEASSDELKSQYPPLSELPMEKPTSKKGSIYQRKRLSVAQGGLTKRLAEAVAAGKTLAQIKTDLAVTGDQIAKSRRRTQEIFGVEVPRERYTRRHFIMLADQIRQDRSDLEITSFLGKIKPSSCLNYLLHSENPPIILIRRAIAQAGYHPRFNQTSMFMEAIKKRNIPIIEIAVAPSGKQRLRRLCVFAAQHLKRVKTAWEEDEDLKRFCKNPVSQPLAKTDKTPTTYQLLSHQGYEPLDQLLFTLTDIRLGHIGSFKFEDILKPDCPVPVFCYKRRYYYPDNEQDILAEYLMGQMYKLTRND